MGARSTRTKIKLAAVWTMAVTGLVLTVGSALAQSQDLGGVADTIRTQMPALVQAATAVGFAIGIFFILAALLALKRMGISGAQYSSISLRNPLLTGVAGVGLLYLTTVAGIGGQTIFGTSGNDVTVQGTSTIN